MPYTAKQSSSKCQHTGAIAQIRNHAWKHTNITLMWLFNDTTVPIYFYRKFATLPLQYDTSTIVDSAKSYHCRQRHTSLRTPPC